MTIALIILGVFVILGVFAFYFKNSVEKVFNEIEDEEPIEYNKKNIYK